MSFSVMLRHFRPADVLIAIRAAAAEQYRPAPLAPPNDPWQGGDPLYASAWAGAPAEIPA